MSTERALRRPDEVCCKARLQVVEHGLEDRLFGREVVVDCALAAAGIVGDLTLPKLDAAIDIESADPIRGIATSGWRGRSIAPLIRA